MCAYISSHRYAKENDEYELLQKKLLPIARLEIVTFQQNTNFLDDHLVDRYLFFLQASRGIHSSKTLYVHYDRTDFATFVKSGGL